MSLMRSSLGKDDIHVVIGKISESGKNEHSKIWAFGEIIQDAQEKFVKTDKRAGINHSTKNYKYSDNWHYDNAGYIDLGKNFEDEVFRLITK